MIIYGTQSNRYKIWQSQQTGGVHNGAYYYAREIEDIILPKVKSYAFIITAGGTLYQKHEIPDKAVMVCHDNNHPKSSYHKLFYKKILWICSKQSTVKKLADCGEKAVYIPLSIDTEYVKKFKVKKTKQTAFVGNQWPYKNEYLSTLPKNIKRLSGLPRDELLKEMAKYKTVIADGRCMLEAMALGAKINLPEYSTFETIERELIDSRDTIPLWQEILDSHIGAPTKHLKALIMFEDIKAGRVRMLGEVFSAPLRRAEELLANKHNIVEVLN